MSKKHSQMTMENRAAQFAPFAALEGHDEAIAESERSVQSKITLSTREIKKIIAAATKALKNRSEVSINYYKPLKFKRGGYYDNMEGILDENSDIKNNIVYIKGIKIKIQDIISIRTSFPGQLRTKGS